MEILAQIAASFGVPAAITGLIVWLFQRHLNKWDKAQDAKAEAREKRAIEQEKNREKLDVVLVKSVMAAIALCEATARAVQRIPDAHCNGDMHQALDYATGVKHELKDFLTSMGVHALHDDQI